MGQLKMIVAQQCIECVHRLTSMDTRHANLAILPFIECHAHRPRQMLLDLQNLDVSQVTVHVLQEEDQHRALLPAHPVHEGAVLISSVMLAHTPVAIISFPKMNNIWLPVVLAALKRQNAAFAVLHLLFGEVHNLQTKRRRLKMSVDYLSGECLKPVCDVRIGVVTFWHILTASSL